MHKMIELETTSNKNQQTFYNVNKHLFYFFYSIYGGGPAIITNETFQDKELIHIQIKFESDSHEEEMKNVERKLRNNNNNTRNQEPP